MGVKSQFVPIYPVFQDICPEFPRGISQKDICPVEITAVPATLVGSPGVKASGFQIIIANP